MFLVLFHRLCVIEKNVWRYELVAQSSYIRSRIFLYPFAYLLISVRVSSYIRSRIFLYPFPYLLISVRISSYIRSRIFLLPFLQTLILTL